MITERINGMLVDHRWSRLRVGVVSLVIIVGLAVAGLPPQKAEAQTTISVRLIQTLKNSELASYNGPFSKQGLLAVRTGDVVQLWDTQTLTLKTSLPAMKNILKAFFTADGKTFITSNKEKSSGLITRLWDAETGRLKHTLSGLIIYQPTDSGLDSIVTLGDRQLQFWNAETGELIQTVPAYKNTFSNSRISFDGRRVIRYGKKSFLWETNTGRLIAELKPPAERGRYIPWYSNLELWDACFSPDSKVIATTDSLNAIELWDAETGRLRALLQDHWSTVYRVAFSPDGRMLASASRDGTARLWDVETGRLIVTAKPGKEIARNVAFNPAGTLLAIGYHTQGAIWDLSRPQPEVRLFPHSDINTMVLFGTYLDGIEILFSPQGRLVLTVGNKTVQVSTAAGEPVTTLKAVHWPVAFAPSEKVLATTGRDGSVQLWAVD
jgi:WD40 repeat protein